jgi:hypothetical protein
MAEPITYPEWISALNAEAERRGNISTHPDDVMNPCRDSFPVSLDDEDWREHFQQGHTPAQALDAEGFIEWQRPATMDDLKAKDADGDAEIERRKHVLTAIADSRIEGSPPPSGIELEIPEAYIRGEIDAGDLVEVYKKGQQQLQSGAKFKNSETRSNHLTEQISRISVDPFGTAR